MMAGSVPAAGEEDWAPPQPSGSEWDWARLDTGEWIKGEMIVLQNEVMLFDSDKFDEVEIDWEDVVDLRLARPRIFRRRGNRIYNGMGEIRDGILRVRTQEDEIVEFAEKEILSIVYTSEQELRNWRMRAGVNLSARAGNTDQQDVSANATIRRDTVYTRWETNYTGTFGEVDGDRTANNHRASTQFDILLTEYFFLRVPFFEFFYDEFQNIDGRYTTGAGLGYQPIDTKLVELMFTLGPGVQITRYDGGEQDEDGAVVFGSGLYFDFPRDIDLDLDYRVQLIATDVGKTNHAASAVLSFEVWDPIDLDLGAYLNRIEKPQRDSNGNRPKRNDFRLTIGLSLDF